MSSLHAAIKDWIKERPYLSEVAKLQEVMATAIDENPAPEQLTNDYDWKNIITEVKKGIPVLKVIKIDDQVTKNAADLLTDIVNALATASLPEKTVQYCQKLQAVLSGNTDLAGRTIKKITGDYDIKLKDLGLDEIDEGFLTFLAWNSLAETLKPLKSKMAELLEENQWKRGYCPICGQLPAMGQLVTVAQDQGRERRLICGCCQMKWQYRRIGCPYCDNQEQEALKIIEVAEEADLRIDTCDKCKSYLKIYTGEGNQQVALADWSTLHLDLIGEKNGYKRTGFQMYKP